MQLTADRTFLNDIDQIRDKVFRITKRILISQEEAEDATQEVIVKLWQMDATKRNGFRSIEAYSVTMAKNYCLDRLKSKQAQNLSLNEKIGNSKMSDSLQTKIEQTDELNWVGTLIDQLPERERMIIQLREIEQYDFDEIASILNLPEGTVRVYLSRIRKKIRKQFLEIQNHGIK
ncbi:MAG: sigma-70 family RNA polymerase sigma factor [Flavobacteriaceae bacterium]|nr:sigma-70 family RNA polymerase sigma factor [Flavobacteriaceae bacterium]MDG2387467.1 sigma-70 family RNA polymerase sigma factor [Flavobacteriaceae bacterium]